MKSLVAQKSMMKKGKYGDILDRSRNIHSNQCLLCPFGHDKEYGILKHLITKHNEWHPQVWCSGCDLLFAQKNKVEHKKLFGNKLKPYECTVPKYRSKWWLKNHIATKRPEIDQDVLQHVCYKCGTELTSKQALKTQEKNCNALTPND